MKNYLLIISLFCVFTTAKAAENLPSISAENISVSNPLEDEDGFLEIIKIVKTETTKREWQLFCTLTAYPFEAQYSFLGEDEKVALSWDEALLCATWLIDNGEESNYFARILQEIDECPAPTPDSVGELCSALMIPEQDNCPTSVAMTYHRVLWNLSCA